MHTTWPTAETRPSKKTWMHTTHPQHCSNEWRISNLECGFVSYPVFKPPPTDRRPPQTTADNATARASNRAWRFTKCCACHDFCTWRLTKTLRLPRILHVKKQVNTPITMEGRTGDHRRQPQTHGLCVCCLGVCDLFVCDLYMCYLSVCVISVCVVSVCVVSVCVLSLSWCVVSVCCLGVCDLCVLSRCVCVCVCDLWVCCVCCLSVCCLGVEGGGGGGGGRIGRRMRHRKEEPTQRCGEQIALAANPMQ